ncbi:lysine-sensitive aspartokinase 3 [Paraferrimonas sedimenticola]|uniref:Aspartokinase n=1 Tax=Paraferrimonas sedimenticola TaxID=375674 RepID=A0AA37W2R2_9GAMM|nr:lysine-sensitive aspartokinase 3 [Paraferrimonas sedimenticola]GLP98142.1 aspartokinase [Paraferrimonas sedimenticola]
MNCSVAKFGGTSVANIDAMRRCADIVLADNNIRVVVVSASAGVTNLLVSLSNGVGEPQLRQNYLSQISEIQSGIFNQLGRPQALASQLDAYLSEIGELAEAQAQQNLPERRERLLSLGEACSSLLFTEVLNQNGGVAECFDAKTVIRTDSHFGRAQVQHEQVQLLANEHLAPRLAQAIQVTQGFVGADDKGQTTTLGRGGSDFSAAIFAEALNADNLQIWTDVAGIYTTDPRMVANAGVIREITFNEAAEMATFGAKVLHPATIVPAVRAGIDVFVGSSRDPQSGGTWIRDRVQTEPTFRALAVRKEQTLLTCHSLNMLHAQGFLAELFAVLAKHHISVDLITTSEVSVALTLDQTGSDSSGKALVQPQLLKDLSPLCEVSVEQDLALIGIIGNRIASTPGVCAKVFELISEFNVRLICQGASPHNICFLVEQNDVEAVVQRLHRALFE